MKRKTVPTPTPRRKTKATTASIKFKLDGSGMVTMELDVPEGCSEDVAQTAGYGYVTLLKLMAENS